MTAPATAGTAREDWKLVNSAGTTINVGTSSTVWVSVTVTTPLTDGATLASETVPDGTSYAAGAAFTKTWTLRNTGTTTWDANYKLRYVSGPAMSDHVDVAVVGTVAPNGTYIFSKAMTAPATAGTAREDWKLVNGAGTTISVGTSSTVWVQIAIQGPAGTTVPGLDVSSNQGTINWTNVALSGRKFAFVRSSQGTDSAYNDTNFTANMNGAAAATILIAPYHVVYPTLNIGTAGAQAEAQHFVSVAGGFIKAGNLRPVADLEDTATQKPGATLGKTNLSIWVDAFMQEVLRLTGISPILYVNSFYAANYIDLSVATKYSLWVADYGNPEIPTFDATRSPATGTWGNWSIWQHTSKGAVPGISGNVDLDMFNGTENSLQQFRIPATLTVLAIPSIAGTVNGGGSFTSGTYQTVTATANTGYMFTNWTEGGIVVSSFPSYSFTLNSNRTIVANFTTNLVNNNGMVMAWGDNTYGQTNIPAGLGAVKMIAAAFYSSLALRSDGTVIAWGDNTYGQTNVPAGLNGVKAIAGGQHHFLALMSDGTVAAWGRNSEGQSFVPVGLSDVTAIVGHGLASLALKGDGTIVAWGDNAYGQTAVPLGLNEVTAIAGGLYHSLALKRDGTIIGWGSNDQGQRNIPAGLSGVRAIACGGYHNLALKTDGTVVAWGWNDYGQTNVPLGLSGVAAIAGGAWYSLALKNDGTVVAWGDNSVGQTTIPADLSGLAAIAAGGTHTVAIISAALSVSPRIALISSGNVLTLIRPDTATGYRIQSTSSLLPPISWIDVIGTFQTNGGSISIPVPLTGMQKFYRLTKP